MLDPDTARCVAFVLQVDDAANANAIRAGATCNYSTIYAPALAPLQTMTVPTLVRAFCVRRDWEIRVQLEERKHWKVMHICNHEPNHR